MDYLNKNDNQCYNQFVNKTFIFVFFFEKIHFKNDIVYFKLKVYVTE